MALLMVASTVDAAAKAAIIARDSFIIDKTNGMSRRGREFGIRGEEKKWRGK
jgi:hypothetical protein